MLKFVVVQNEDGMRVLPLVERMGTLSVGLARDKLP